MCFNGNNCPLVSVQNQNENTEQQRAVKTRSHDDSYKFLLPHYKHFACVFLSHI